MNEISTTVAFWILEAWRRLDSQLQTSFPNSAGFSTGDPVRITRTDPAGATFSIESVATDFRQNRECEYSATSARFSFEASSESTAILTIEFSNSNKMLLAEAPRVAQELAEQLIASFKTGISPQDSEALNHELAGLSYEEIRARVAESIARTKPPKS